MAITSIGGTLTVFTGLIISWQKIARTSKRSKELQAAKILQEAKEADVLLKTQLEARIEKLESKVENLEENINKDMAHLKETYTAEIKVLGEKIEQLRDELRNQHSQMVTLLSKLIESKD